MNKITLLIDSKDYPTQNPNDLTIVLDEELAAVSGIRLEQLRVPITFYNIYKDYTFFITENSISFFEVIIPAGFYDYHSFTKTVFSKINELEIEDKQIITIDLDKTTGKVKITTKENYTFYPTLIPDLKPFSYFFINCDLIDTAYNFYNGKRSNILTSVMVKKCKYNEILEYNLNEDFKKCDNQFNQIRLHITDEHMKPIEFNNGHIMYTLNFLTNK